MNTIAVNATKTGREPRKYLIVNLRQKSVLEAAFANNYYLNKTTLMHVAQETGLCKEQIRVWFQNRRSCIRRARNKGTISIRECICIPNYLRLHVSTCTCVYLRIY